MLQIFLNFSLAISRGFVDPFGRCLKFEWRRASFIGAVDLRSVSIGIKKRVSRLMARGGEGTSCVAGGGGWLHP